MVEIEEAESESDAEEHQQQLLPNGSSTKSALDEQDQEQEQQEAAKEAEKKSREEHQKVMDNVEEEKRKMDPAQKLMRAGEHKASGNAAYKQGNVFDATREYYMAINFAKNLTLRPDHYPDIRHTWEQHKEAKELCVSVYCNIALSHLKYAHAVGMSHPERKKALNETVRMAGEALRLNDKCTKAFHRRAGAKSALAKSEHRTEQLRLLGEARKDLMSAVEAEPQNREVREELKATTDRLKALKKEELSGERKEFDFGSTLGALTAKERDLLGDGSIKKLITEEGSPERWLNDEWLQPDSPTKCVVHIRCQLLSSTDKDGHEMKCTGGSPTPMSWYVGDKDMHDGFDLAVRSMEVGESARFTFQPVRWQATGSMVRRLTPVTADSSSVWDLTFEKYQLWQDLDRDGKRLLKVFDEGWGRFPEHLFDIAAHSQIVGPDGKMHFSTRSSHQGNTKEEDDKDPPSYVIGETCWDPMADLLKFLRTGGVGELRLKSMPPLPQTSDENGKKAMDKGASGRRGQKDLNHCTIHAELKKVEPPLSGPEDQRWEGNASIVQERARAGSLLDLGMETHALTRLRRCVCWASSALETFEPEPGSMKQLALCRASLGWVLVCKAAPILDAGNVKSDVLAVANRELDEAKEQCDWLEQKAPKMGDTCMLRAKILVAEDDDFDGALIQLLEAERLSPRDKRIQDELAKVRKELRRMESDDEHGEAKTRLLEICEELKRARSEAVGRDETVMELLQEILETSIPFGMVGQTDLVAEIESCREVCGDEVKEKGQDVLSTLPS